MGFPKFMRFCFSGTELCRGEGIEIVFVKRRGLLQIHGWYDSFVAIGFGEEEITLGKFLNGLGITLKDCEKALKD